MAVLVGLVALSVAVDSPATDAAPNVFAGAFVVVVAWLVVRADGLGRPLSVATAAALAIGGLGAVYEGAVDLGALPAGRQAILATEVVLLVGLGLFLYDRVLATPR